MGATVFAIGGGKGGTGKSLVAAQLGIALAAQGKRVVLVDADLQGGNLHTFFGLEDPAIAFEWILHKQGDAVRAVLPTGTKNLGLVPGIREAIHSTPGEDVIREIFSTLRGISADVLLMDVGSGCGMWACLVV